MIYIVMEVAKDRPYRQPWQKLLSCEIRSTSILCTQHFYSTIYVSTHVRALEYPSRLPLAGTAHFSDYKFDGMKLLQGTATPAASL